MNRGLYKGIGDWRMEEMDSIGTKKGKLVNLLEQPLKETQGNLVLLKLEDFFKPVSIRLIIITQFSFKKFPVTNIMRGFRDQ